jgi:DNA repair protein RadC
MKKVKEMPVFNRPREKLQAKGPKALSDKELLAILLRSGTQTQDVLTLAGKILKVLDDTSANPMLDQLLSIDGIGPAKATTILAALEFARRRISPEGFKIGQPPDVLPLIQHMADRKQEHFLCISLNGAHEVIAVRTISVGLVNKTQVHPREVFADSLTDRATAIIVAHNHPTANLTPSKDDIIITRQLKSAGETLGIRLLDHIIFSHKGYYSFAENKQLD